MSSATNKEAIDRLFEEYLPLAIEHLSLRNWRRQEELLRVEQDIRANFYFPDLEHPYRLLLVGLGMARRGLIIALNSEGITEAARENSEAHFMEARELTQRHVIPQLRPLQLEILDAEYLSVPLKGEG